MISVTVVSLEILTGTFCNCLWNENVLIMARGNGFVTHKKALIVKLTTISSFM